MTKQRRGRSIDGDIQDIIVDKTTEGWGPTQIHRYLEKLLYEENVKNEKKKDWEDRDPPDIRTIQRIAKGLSKDTSGTWSIEDSEGEDVRLVLEVLVDRLAAGITKFFTKSEAEWIIKVRKAAPDARNNIVYLLAFLYSVKEDAGFDTRAMDGYLAFSPWRDKDSFRRYKRAVAQKIIPRVPMWSILVDDLSESVLLDPRFGQNAALIFEFEKDISERVRKGESLDSIADLYNIHMHDIKDIIQKYEKGGAQ